MKNRIIAALVATTLLLAVSAWAQYTTIVGKVTDETGQPIAEATVEFVNKDNGRKVALKTDKRGEYKSLGVSPGNYVVSLFRSGTKVWEKQFTVSLALPENRVDFDLKKDRSAAVAQLTEEQKKQIEAAQKENQKIKGLNERLNAARTAMEAGNFDAAAQTLTEATQIDPNRDLLWARLGDVYLAQAGKLSRAEATPILEKSIAAYAKAVELGQQPTSDAKARNLLGSYYNNYGQALGKLGKTQEATQAYEQAAAADPAGAASYYYNMGAVLTNVGQVDAAIAAFDKVITADPAKADAYYWKGINLIGKATLKGDKMIAPEGTADAFNKYLELQPEGQFAEPAKQMLATIGAEVQTSYGKGRAKKK